MKQEVNPGIIAAAVVVVLALIGIVGFMVLGKHKDNSSLNASNPQYQNYLKGAGSSGPSGSPNSYGSPNHGSPGSGSPGSGSPGSGSPGSGSPN